MHAHLVISGAILALSFTSPAQAQVTLDASKVTCDQFVHSKIGEPRTVAAWLSGFYNGKSNNAVIDKQDFEANLTKLVNFCYDEKNFKVPVMQAVERAIGSGKKLRRVSESDISAIPNTVCARDWHIGHAVHPVRRKSVICHGRLNELELATPF